MTVPVAFSALDVRTADGNADAYPTRPDDGAAHPGVLFNMDAYGLRPWLREMMQAIAADGYTVLAGITAELLIAHASQDDSIPREQITRLEKALDAADARYASVVYPNTRHGFTRRDTPVFDQVAYDRHLTDLLDLLHRSFPSP
ncbi:dienelactone hydrolase family protein [Nocardia pseudovaccinii]|uniref:dienelactone hydrolase family protein n=1 Tax=Nocardia pseudovaccinii TaxID=189540 RepID=UPI003D8B3FC0